MKLLPILLAAISPHWDLFFQNRLPELFPPTAASMFVQFRQICKSVIIFWDEVFMVRNTVKKLTNLIFGRYL